MKLEGENKLLRIFIGESDTLSGKSLFEAIVLKARELNLAGATVTRGVMGFGATSRIHSSKVLQLSEDLPVIIEIVDTKDKIDTLIPFLDEYIKDGLVTIENVEAILYRHNKK